MSIRSLPSIRKVSYSLRFLGIFDSYTCSLLSKYESIKNCQEYRKVTGLLNYNDKYNNRLHANNNNNNNNNR